MGDMDAPDVDSASADDDESSSGSARLPGLLNELRMRLEALDPDDQVRRRDAIELIRQAQERIVALEQMLAWARVREEELTTGMVQGDIRLAELEATVEELTAIAETAAEADAGRLRAESKAGELQERLRASRAELQAKEVELRRATERNRGLEADLTTLGDELASSRISQTKVERLQRERDVAVERTRAEARTALDERLRAADLERQLTLLQDRFRAVEQGSDDLLDEDVTIGTLEADEVDDTVVLLEDALVDDDNGFEEDDSVEEDEPLEDDNGYEEDEIVDLRQGQHVPNGEAAGVDEAVVWGTPPQRGGFMGWLRRGFAEDDVDDAE